jgi:hypothetical protein
MFEHDGCIAFRAAERWTTPEDVEQRRVKGG